MKTYFIFFAFLIFFKSQCQETYPTLGCSSTSCDICFKDKYTTLLFSDEFDGNNLDKNKWVPQWGVMRSPQGTQQFYYGDNNIEVSNGTLKIYTKKLSTPITETYWLDGQFTSDFYYTSAEIHSLFQFGYGKYEIRCRIPWGSGIFPAFWLYSDNPWDEIDIFDEKFNEQNNIFHWKAACTHHIQPPYSGCGGRNISLDNLADFSQWHIFTLYYTPYAISIEIDNGDTYIWTQSVLRWYLTTDFVNQCIIPPGVYWYMDDCFIPQKPMNIILNTAVLSDYYPNDATFEIDYIRYYDEKDCCNNVVINNKSELNLNSNYSDYYNYLCGNTITINDDIFLNNNENLHIVANDEIVINSLDIENGAFFEAETNNICNSNKNIELTDTNTYVNNNANANVYPNPVKKIINIELNNFQPPYNYELIGIDGSIVYSNRQNINKFSINIKEKKINNGIYILRISNQEKGIIYCNKIVIIN